MAPARSVLVVAPLLCTLALAGCLTNSSPLGPEALPVGNLPRLPALGFLPEVSIDPGHRGGEPSIVADLDNNYYVSAPSGFVSTVFNSVIDPTLLPAQGPANRQSFIWKSSDQGASWNLLTITPPPLPPLRGDLVIGGADTDLAVDACNTVYFTDLWLGNIGVSHSDDGGATWQGVPITGIAPVLDRNWIAADTREGHCGTVYLLFQTFYQQLWVLKSTDKGMTFPQQVLVMDCNPTAAVLMPQVEGCYGIDGNILFDASSGSLHFIAGLADGNGVWVFHSGDEGATWMGMQVPMAADVNNVFPVLAADNAGNLYAVVSMLNNGSYNIYLTQSTDHGMNWSEPRAISGPEDSGTEVFPWVAAGDAGKVAVVWYGVNDTVETTDAVTGDWFVYMAASEDAAGASPTWTYALVSEKPFHKGEICTLGLTCTLPQPLGTRGNRNLADFFEVGIDREGRAIVTWANDYEVADQFISVPFFAKQSQGTIFAVPSGNATG
ncbi:MAG TPA: sialidase family protein [Candidatus Thermoplasmatota archaeon]|jgi:hypothetical protein|nr:sialidase family protein [Candidatus Thermoplasmatota archaeon]